MAILLKETTKVKPTTPKNAIYSLVIEWPGEMPDDVDLWVSDSVNHIVGFNRREGNAGSLHSLDHDDQGHINDVGPAGIIPKNMETVNLRGFYPGEYVVNAHMYAKRTNAPTSVTISLFKAKGGKKLKSVTKEMVQNGDELTFFRFKLGERGEILGYDDKQKIIAQVGNDDGNEYGPEQMQ